MNKTIKFVIYISVLCLSTRITYSMEHKEGLKLNAIYSKKLNSFIGTLNGYIQDPSDENFSEMWNLWEIGLNNDEKVIGYKIAQEKGVSLENLGFEKPRLSKKAKVEEPKLETTELEETIEEKLESNPELKYVSDIEGERYILTLGSKEKLERQLAELKVEQARSMINESSYQNLLEKNIDIVNENKKLEHEIQSILAKNLELENKIQFVADTLSQASSTKNASPAELRLNAILVNSNKALMAELEHLQQKKENLENELKNK